MSEHPWHFNDHGLWCPSCGNRVASPIGHENPPEECRECGFPDPEKVADYHLGNEEDWDQGSDHDELEFDCGMMPDGTCSLAGSEDCDWECPHRDR